ncbi:hypothetical protein Pan153_37730 [Gimesia panareensis]|uniref:DinB superfamily protein n=1 Tax=Gimesia panareensis TaxID=2527978 RepID=A0A518FS33_9PLAN|nr:hypothetical protein [Gimesia panareensis]QDV19110.1 hypothetical protein Pan153_37730 [Gimesia panareensis]
MTIQSKRDCLRHFLATLAYRGTNVLQDLPAELSTHRPAEVVRSPVEILNHVNGVLTYAVSFFEPLESTRPELADWETEVDRFFQVLTRLDLLLADDVPLNEVSEEQLLQGPLADAMLHLGQIGIFRRMGGSPVAAENYVLADIQIGKLRRPS